MDLNLLRRQYHEHRNKMENFLTEVEKRSERKMTDAERLQYDKWEMELKERSSEIERVRVEQDAEVASLLGQSCRGMAGRTYRSLFGSPGNEARADAFCQALISGQIPAEFRVSTTSNGPSLGFAIPDEISAVFFDMALASEYVRPRCLIWPMSGPKRSVPVFDDETQTSTIFGFTPQWKAEGGTFSVEDVVLRRLSLECKSLGLFTSFSSELSQDGGNDLIQSVKSAMAGAVGASIDRACTIGSGVGEPLGALNAACRILVARSAANQILYTDVLNMQAKLLPRGNRTSVWLVSNSALPQLLALKDASNRLLFQNFDQGLLGSPVIVSDVVPSLGTQGDLSLCDFSKYAIGLRRELTFESTNAYHWNQNIIDIRGILRMDGQPIFSKAVTLRNGDIVSPFVLLK